MKFKPAALAIFSLVFVLSSLGAGFWAKAQDKTLNQELVFVSLGASALPNESSSYEVQRAVEHFSDVLLGWTVEPHFKQEYTASSFSGQRQEKQNLLFTLDTDKAEDAEAFVQALDARLSEYNAATGSSFVLGLTRITAVEKEVYPLRPALGFVVLALLVTGFLLTLWDYATHRR